MNNLDNIFSQLKKTEPVIEDDSFTTSIITKIPEVYELPLWKKNLILLFATCLGSGVAAWALPIGDIFPLITNLGVVLSFLTIIAMAIYVMSLVVVWDDQSFSS